MEIGVSIVASYGAQLYGYCPNPPRYTGEKAMTYLDLNRWSAEKVMGWIESPMEGDWWTQYITTKHFPDGAYEHLYHKNKWHPLTNCNQQRLVIEKMRELGWYFSIGDEYNSVVAPFYYACFINLALNKRTENYGNDLPTAVLQAAYEALSSCAANT